MTIFTASVGATAVFFAQLEEVVHGELARPIDSINILQSAAGKEAVDAKSVVTR